MNSEIPAELLIPTPGQPAQTAVLRGAILLPRVENGWTKFGWAAPPCPPDDAGLVTEVRGESPAVEEDRLCCEFVSAWGEYAPSETVGGLNAGGRDPNHFFDTGTEVSSRRGRSRQ
jgi:hypothetical protein